MASQVKPFHQTIPSCISGGVDQGRFVLVFQSEKAADAFDAVFEGLIKANEAMAKHCSVYVPQGSGSWKEYKTELGTKNVSAFNVALSDEFTSADLSRFIASAYKK